MYLKKDEAIKLLSELKKNLADSVIEKIDFLMPLLDADDWTMIIKSHAVLENIITNLIITKIDEPKLKKLIERLPLSDNEIGKLLIIKEYDLIPEDQRTFIKKLSNLRNNIIHKYENLNFKLSEYLNSLDKNQLRSWEKSVTWFAEDLENKEQWIKISMKTPEIVLWISIFMFITITVIKNGEYNGDNKITALALETTKSLFKNV